MILLRVAAIVIVLPVLMTGCETLGLTPPDQRIATLEAKVAQLEKVADYLKNYEPECGFPGKRQHVDFECYYRLTISDKDKEGSNTAYGTLPNDVVNFHAANCRNYKAELPKNYPCPEYDDYKNLKWFFKIDTSTVENGQTYNLISNKGARSLRVDPDQTAPIIPQLKPATAQ